MIKSFIRLVGLSFLKSAKTEEISSAFAEIYSKLWDYAEHSISHLEFQLPSALGSGSINRVNTLLSELYSGRFASLSFGGSSGALITLLTAVLPKLQPKRDIILFDDVCHQSTIGGLIFGRWKAMRLPRTLHPDHQTVLPLSFETVKNIIEAHGPEHFAAIILVLPSYDGFRSPKEDKKIYRYAKSHGISVIVDGAWDSTRFRLDGAKAQPLDSICDVWITSPHKRGLTPSSLGCIITHSKTIARLWDEALDLGFRSSSLSFLEIMIAEHRLEQIISGAWNLAFAKAEQSAKRLRSQIKDIHPDIYAVAPQDVQAEMFDPAHILICTRRIPNFDARIWAKILSTEFNLDIEKATASTLLLLCASPAHFDQIDDIIQILKIALNRTLLHTEDRHHAAAES